MITYIIDAMNWEDNQVYLYDHDLYEHMIEELHQRVGEIKDGYIQVWWRYEHESDDMQLGDETKSEFSYDPKNGEKCSVEYYEGDDTNEVKN